MEGFQKWFFLLQNFKVMKRIFLLLILAATIKGHGQTYTIKIERNYGGGCHGGKTWSLSGSSKIGSGSFTTVGITTTTYSSVPLSNSFNLTLNFTCTPYGSDDLECTDDLESSGFDFDLI